MADSFKGVPPAAPAAASAVKQQLWLQPALERAQPLHQSSSEETLRSDESAPSAAETPMTTPGPDADDKVMPEPADVPAQEQVADVVVEEAPPASQPPCTSVLNFEARVA